MALIYAGLYQVNRVRADGARSGELIQKNARFVRKTDARLKYFELGKLVIDFRKTAPSKLYWADRPAMRIVQALHWLQDVLPRDGERIRAPLRAILGHPDHGVAIVEDLRSGIGTLPAWMQNFLRDLLNGADARDG